MKTSTATFTTYTSNYIEVTIEELNQSFRQMTIFGGAEGNKLVIDQLEYVRSLIKTLNLALVYLQKNYEDMRK